MTKRRRRWLRRLTIGVSFAALAAPAAAQPVQPAESGGGGMQIVSVSPSTIVDRTLSPDARGDRLPPAESVWPGTSVHNTSVSWDGAVTLGLGTLVLVVSLGLGLGYIRRPRIAGL